MSKATPACLVSCAITADSPFSIIMLRPSGLLRTSWLSAVSPPPPGRFSTTTVAPVMRSKCGASIRAYRS